MTLSLDASHTSLKIRMFDAAGKIVKEMIHGNGQGQEVPLPVAPGVYFIELESEQDKAVFLVYKY